MASRKGFVWDEEPRSNPVNISPEDSEYANVEDDGVLENGTYNITTTELEHDKTYYVRAFGYDDVEDVYSYGDEVSFSTPPIGVIETLTANNVTYNSALLRGNVLELNSPNLVGSFKYSVVGSGIWQETDVDLIGVTGPFNQTVTGLIPETEYQYMFVTTYLTEEVSGDIQTFTTLPIERGFVYDTISHATPEGNPSSSDYTGYTDVGIKKGFTFGTTLTGLNPNTVYYYRAYYKLQGNFIYSPEDTFITGN